MRDGIFWPRISLPTRDAAAWAKGAVLFWESITRIVPSDYEPNDHPDIKLLMEANIFQTLNPAAQARIGEKTPLEEVHDTFVALLNDRSTLRQLQARYDVERSSEWTGQSTTMASYQGADHDPKYGYLLGTRVWGPLRKQLIGSGLAKQMKDSGWLGTHPLLADACIGSLAAAMAGDRSSLITDQPSVFASGDFTLETLRNALLKANDGPGSHRDTNVYPDERMDARSALIACIIEGLNLDGIEDVPVRQILDIRKKHSSVRQNFLSEFDKIESSINGAANPQQRVNAIRTVFRDRIEGPLENLRHELRMLSVGVGAAATATFLGAALKGSPALYFDLGIGSLFLGVCALVPLLKNRLESSPAKKRPMGYLHLLERDLTQAKLVQRVETARNHRVELERHAGLL